MFCEQRFGNLDNYGIHVLINRLDSEFVAHPTNGEPVAFISTTVDHQRLKMFVLSVLWRASVSSHDFYSDVILGQYQEPLLHVIRNGLSQDVDEFSVILSKWTSSDDRSRLATSLFDPARMELGGVNVVLLYLGNVLAYVKVDQIPFSGDFRELVLGMHDRTYMLARRFDSSREIEIMRMIARSSMTPQV